MSFPDRVLSPEQREQRAKAVIDHIAFSIEAWGGWECLTRHGQRGLTKAWCAMQSELTATKESVQ